MRKIDLVTPFQKQSITQIRDAHFMERTASGECVFEIDVWSYYVIWIFDQCPDYKVLPQESFVYRFCWNQHHDLEYLGDETVGEVEIDRLEEFYEYLQSIYPLAESFEIKPEMDAILEICRSAIAHQNKLFLIADY